MSGKGADSRTIGKFVSTFLVAGTIDKELTYLQTKASGKEKENIALRAIELLAQQLSALPTCPESPDHPGSAGIALGYSRRSGAISLPKHESPDIPRSKISSYVYRLYPFVTGINRPTEELHLIDCFISTECLH